MVDAFDSLSLILELIRSGQAVARPALQQASGLGRGIVAERVNLLLDRGLIAEGRLAQANGGRAARELQIRAEAGALLVAYGSLGGFVAGVADLSGHVLASECVACSFAEGPSALMGEIKAIWNRLRPQADIWGIGVGLPAHISFDEATLLDSPSLPTSWTSYHPRRDLSPAFGAQTWVDTDDNMLALGELRVDRTGIKGDFLYMFADLVLGAATVVDGKVYRGAQGAAGNIGHIHSEGADDLCRCGRRGCLEAAVGGEALIHKATMRARAGESARLMERIRDNGGLCVADLGEAAREGDAVAVSLLTEAGRRIGLTLASAVNLFNPSAILVGGSLAATSNLFLAALKTELYRQSLPFVSRDLAVVPATQDVNEMGLVGAAHMVLDQIFNAQSMARWLREGRSPAVLASHL
ncbi:ROK family protein [Labrys wisconsinensis]|uniref:NBD/HSP70 family sugar kinase n=1 Tax=Labrys wisconsinensis TaxID=425677 RepID=A0ABU0J1W3_9HYPH|nr:ROK family protein [Labrys wisconsinensis]MDQ0468248.1 putative NBD/HSP70 family sugar kinase [Labrys wisconsinensis]